MTTYKAAFASKKTVDKQLRLKTLDRPPYSANHLLRTPKLSDLFSLELIIKEKF